MTALRPLSVYVHIPFCTVKCGYCDFNAYAGLDALKAAYGSALTAEVRAAAPLFAGREVVTVAFGGGTPGEVPAADIAAVLDSLRCVATLSAGAEISLEANPGTTDATQLRQLREAGVNRVSFGAQSFDPGELRFLDRIHSPEATAASVANARRAGIGSVGLDLIYGLPEHTVDRWRRSVCAALALAPDHVSTYALTVEEGTPLGRRVGTGEVRLPDPDALADMYETASEMLAGAGLRQYELSNWAVPGHDSRHNSVYWSDGDYLAIGAGAHGYIDGERYENVAHPRDYIERVRAGGAGEARPALLSAYRPDEATAMFDWVTLALRRIEGLAPEAFRERFGTDIDKAIGGPLALAAEAGVIDRGERIRLTERGCLLHGELAAEILAYLGR